MTVTKVQSDIATPPGRPYSQAVRSGPIVAISGQTPVGPDGACIAPGDAAGQTEYVLDRIERLLGDGGASLDDVVKVTIFLSSFDHFAAVNAAYGARFREPRPARTAVACELVRADFLVEIDALAVIDR